MSDIYPVLAAYDVTRKETFESIEDIWMREVDMYSTVDNAVKMIVANKVDKVTPYILIIAPHVNDPRAN